MNKTTLKILSITDKQNNYKLISFCGLKISFNPLFIMTIISSILDRIIPKQKNKIVFNSYPDFSDNTFCYYKYLITKYPDQYEMVWILSDPTYNLIPANNIKVFKLYSIKGLFHIFSAKYIISNHCNDFVNMIHSKRHIWLNLWHGMPLKTLGFTEKNITDKNLYRYKLLQKYSYQFVTSDIFKLSMISCFLSNPNRVFITGQPRTDYIFSTQNKDKIHDLLNLDKFNKVILFTPTYKECKRKDGGRDVDHLFNNMFYMDDYSQSDFYKFLEKNNILFLIKPHMFEEKFYQKLQDNNYFNHPHIKIIYNKDLDSNNLYFYEIFRLSDLMITDFSSIAIDYLITEKPVIFLNSLSEEYNKNRGFILENNYEILMPGTKTHNFDELLNAIEDAILTDSWEKERLDILPIIHKYKDNKSSERIYKIMKGLK